MISQNLFKLSGETDTDLMRVFDMRRYIIVSVH